MAEVMKHKVGTIVWAPAEEGEQLLAVVWDMYPSKEGVPMYRVMVIDTMQIKQGAAALWEGFRYEDLVPIAEKEKADAMIGTISAICGYEEPAEKQDEEPSGEPEMHLSVKDGRIHILADIGDGYMEGVVSADGRGMHLVHILEGLMITYGQNGQEDDGNA